MCTTRGDARDCARQRVMKRRGMMGRIRGLALFAWVANLLHLFSVFHSSAVIPSTLRSFLLILSAAASALPAMVGASVLLFHPFDLDSAYALLMQDRVSVGLLSAKDGAKMADTRHPVAANQTAEAVATTTRRGSTRSCDGAGGTSVSPASVSDDARSDACSQRSDDGHVKVAAEAAATAAVDADPFSSTQKTKRRSSTPEDDGISSSDVGSVDENDKCWQDAIAGIKGMAEALCQANNSASLVALNSDLTVSLSTLLLKTINLLDSTVGLTVLCLRATTTRFLFPSTTHVSAL